MAEEQLGLEVASPEALRIDRPAGVEVVFHPDGTVEYGGDYDPDETARAFWEAMGRERARPDLLERLGRAVCEQDDAYVEACRTGSEDAIQREGDELTDRIEALREALG